jgi:hypothetical protein
MRWACRHNWKIQEILAKSDGLDRSSKWHYKWLIECFFERLKFVFECAFRSLFSRFCDRIIMTSSGPIHRLTLPVRPVRPPPRPVMPMPSLPEPPLPEPPLPEPPLPEPPVSKSVNKQSLGIKIQALTLLIFNPGPRSNELYDRVYQIIKIPPRTQRALLAKAAARGYDPNIDLRLHLHYVEDAPKLGRPRSARTEAIIKAVIEFLERDLSTSEASAEVIAYNTNISTSSVLRILKEKKYDKLKSVTKPGLNIEMREARLHFCLAHEHWTLDMWKLVIWSDETSVVLG